MGDHRKSKLTFMVQKVNKSIKDHGGLKRK